MEWVTFVLKITELGLMNVVSGIFVFIAFTMLKKLISDTTNKELSKQIAELSKKFEQGHLNKEGLKDLMPFFVQSVRWKLQNSLIDIININNINKNFDIVIKKIDLYYSKERNKLNGVLSIMSTDGEKYLILHTVIADLEANERVVKSIIEEVRDLGEVKYDKEKYRSDIKTEMAQFEENAISNINNALGG